VTELPPDPLGWVSPEEYAHIRALVDSAPPLTDAQKSILAVLLAPPLQEWPAHTERAAG
jgi:hypothetical protein